MQGPDSNSNWFITGSNSGSLGNITFTNMPHLCGGIQNDSFKFDSNGSLTGSINGGDGSKPIVEAANSNTWMLTRGNEGTVTGIPFRFIQNLTGKVE